MLTASHAGWFTAAFVLAVPIMLVIFRDSDGLTRDAWIKSLIFAASVAAIIAISFGKGKP